MKEFFADFEARILLVISTTNERCQTWNTCLFCGVVFWTTNTVTYKY